MTLSEKKAVLLANRENIEMELFSSVEPCMMVPVQEEEEHSFYQTHLEDSMVPDCEGKPEPKVQTQPRKEAKPKSEPPAREETKHCTPVPGFMEEIEMEMLPPHRMSESELVEIKSGDPSIKTPPSAKKISHLKWKRMVAQKTGLVVKDVVCLPRGHYLAQLERHYIPQSKELAALAAMGLTARITIDYSWSAKQMESRLATLFRGQFSMKQSGQRFSVTYLQCVQGSRVLFVPDTPAEGWTGEQLLRICGHGPLYIFTHQDYPQAVSEQEGVLS